MINIKRSLLFTVVILICAAQSLSAADTSNWTPPRSMNELLGRWEGSVIIPISGDTEKMLPNSSFRFDLTFEYIVSYEVNVIMRLDMERFLVDFIEQPQLKAMGLSKDTIWQMLSLSMADDEEMTFGEYYVSRSMSYPLPALRESSLGAFIEGFDGQLLLNEERNKMLMDFSAASVDFSMGLGGESNSQIILDKR
ncbi:MAG: hypothetical protein FWD28_02245 [Treponema sp.]|nr:hypothetical protein [Treponema sp.]